EMRPLIPVQRLARPSEILSARRFAPKTRQWFHASARVRNDEQKQQHPPPQVPHKQPAQLTQHTGVDLPVNVPGPGSAGAAPNTGGAAGGGIGSESSRVVITVSRD